MNDVLNENKKRAVEFYKMAYYGNPQKAARLYIGAQYVQHNPLVSDGIQGFIDYFEKMHLAYPNKSITFVRSVSEGSMVALHTHQVWGVRDEYVTMDFFRFDNNGKIIEHWDSIQKIPDDLAHSNTMY